jgi:hypothetical protein
MRPGTRGRQGTTRRRWFIRQPGALTGAAPGVYVLLLVMAAASASVPSAQSDGAQVRAVGDLKASNPDEDDHLSAGNALTGDGLASAATAPRWRSAPGEDSASGINGRQRTPPACRGRLSSAARGRVGQAYVKASNPSGDSSALPRTSGDGSTSPSGQFRKRRDRRQQRPGDDRRRAPARCRLTRTGAWSRQAPQGVGHAGRRLVRPGVA